MVSAVPITLILLFGVLNEVGNLVPIGKAYTGFTDLELLKLDKFVRNNTIGRFGPVRGSK